MDRIDGNKPCKITENNHRSNKQQHDHSGKQNSEYALVKGLSWNTNLLLCIPDIAILGRVHIEVILEALPSLEEIERSFTECVINQAPHFDQEWNSVINLRAEESYWVVVVLHH